MATVAFLRRVLEHFHDLDREYADGMVDTSGIAVRFSLLEAGTLSQRNEVITLQSIVDEILRLPWQDDSDLQGFAQLQQEVVIELRYLTQSDDMVALTILLQMQNEQDSLNRMLVLILALSLYLKDRSQEWA